MQQYAYICYDLSNKLHKGQVRQHIREAQSSLYEAISWWQIPIGEVYIVQSKGRLCPGRRSQPVFYGIQGDKLHVHFKFGTGSVTDLTYLSVVDEG